MDPRRWAKIEGIFHAALERPPDQRPAFLAAACGGDADLLREVLQLLEKTEKVSEEHLNGKIPGADYSLKVLLRGIAEHNLYHAGQIGMLRRAAPPE